MYTATEYQAWRKAALEPGSVLAYESGICRGEIRAPQRDCVFLRDSPDENGEWGTIEIKPGLKRDARAPCRVYYRSNGGCASQPVVTVEVRESVRKLEIARKSSQPIRWLINIGSSRKIAVFTLMLASCASAFVLN